MKQQMDDKKIKISHYFLGQPRDEMIIWLGKATEWNCFGLFLQSYGMLFWPPVNPPLSLALFLHHKQTEKINKKANSSFCFSLILTELVLDLCHIPQKNRTHKIHSCSLRRTRQTLDHVWSLKELFYPLSIRIVPTCFYWNFL